MKRLFVAISFEPSADFAKQYAILKRCTCKLDRVNWVKGDLMHLTLKFLGDTEESRISDLCHLLEAVAAHHRAFSITLDRIGAFGSRYQPRVVWLGPSETSQPLLRLQHEVEMQLRENGFPPTYGKFVSHLTLARINFIDNKKYFWEGIDSCNSLFDETFSVKGFALYESILQKGCPPKYLVLRQFDLFPDAEL